LRGDAAPPGGAHGTDIDEAGNGTVSAPRMYRLIRQPRAISEGVFEVEFLGSGIDVFGFTFGRNNRDSAARAGAPWLSWRE